MTAYRKIYAPTTLQKILAALAADVAALAAEATEAALAARVAAEAARAAARGAMGTVAAAAWAEAIFIDWADQDQIQRDREQLCIDREELERKLAAQTPIGEPLSNVAAAYTGGK